MRHRLILGERHLVSGQETSREYKPCGSALVLLLLDVNTRSSCVYPDFRAIARH